MKDLGSHLVSVNDLERGGKELVEKVRDIFSGAGALSNEFSFFHRQLYGL